MNFVHLYMSIPELIEPINVIIFAYLCNDERCEDFDPKILCLFRKKYVGPSSEIEFGKGYFSMSTTNVMISFYRDYIDISFDDGEYLYDYETKNVTMTDYRHLGITQVTDRDGKCISAHFDKSISVASKEISLPTSSEILRLPLQWITNFDPTGEFRLLEAYKHLIQSGKPEEIMNNPQYDDYVSRCVNE